MDRALESPPFNLVMHTAPFAEDVGDGLSLAHRDHAEADARRRLRVGDRVLHQPDAAGRSGAGAARRCGYSLKADPAVWYFEGSGGNSSVVECDLAKVEVAGSNPVSRSNIFFSPGSQGRVARPAIRLSTGRRRQAVRQRSAKPPPPVQIRAAPPFSPEQTHVRYRRNNPDPPTVDCTAFRLFHRCFRDGGDLLFVASGLLSVAGIGAIGGDCAFARRTHLRPLLS